MLSESNVEAWVDPAVQSMLRDICKAGLQDATYAEHREGEGEKAKNAFASVSQAADAGLHLQGSEVTTHTT